MPIDFYGYEFDDPRIAQGARQQGLTGALYGMQQGRQDPNDWAGFLTGAATGFDKGYQGYLADYLPIHLQQQQQAEAEMERQRQEEMAGRRVDWMQGRLSDFMGPEQGIGGPVEPPPPDFMGPPPPQPEPTAGAPEFDYTIMPSEQFGSQSEYANYLSQQLPQVQETMAEREQAEMESQRNAEMLDGVNRTLAGLGYSGPPIPDVETGLAVLKQYAEPEAEMTPYQQAQVARWGRQDAQGGEGGLTPTQEWNQRKYLYEADLDRYQEEDTAEANADPIFEDVMAPQGVQPRGGVPTGERPSPEQFGLMMPGTQPAPGATAAPTGTSPAPKQRTVTPEPVKRAATAKNIAQSLDVPEAVKSDPAFLEIIEAELEDKTPDQIRRELRKEARDRGFWLGGRQ